MNIMKTLVVSLLAGLVLCSLALAGDSTEVKTTPDSTEVKAMMEEPVEVKGALDSLETKKDAVKEPVIQTTESGVKYQDLLVGTGTECKTGDSVLCHYTLWFADSTGEKQKRFQSSKDKDLLFECTLGRGLIKGWSDGMVGMKEGGTRRLIISPELGYGKGGREIPADQWLVFEIEFAKLK
jgi:FKBP-type peptidyl-prolyl cis-trans isomerase FkpA